MENQELKCIKEIVETIEKYGFEFPEVAKESVVDKSPRGHKTPLHTIKRVLGILKNANEENAEQKLESLLKFLSVIKNQK